MHKFLWVFISSLFLFTIGCDERGFQDATPLSFEARWTPFSSPAPFVETVVPTQVSIESPEITPVPSPLTVSTPISVALHFPATIEGQVLDKVTGESLEQAVVLAMPLDDAMLFTRPMTGTAMAIAETNAEGFFVFEALPEKTQLQVLMPGYRKEIQNIVSSQAIYDIELTPFEVKAIYLTAYTAAGKSTMEQMFGLLETTELNAIVIDVKLDALGEVGKVAYPSELPAVRDLKTSVNYLDMSWIVQQARERGIYTIARLPIMRDDVLARAQPAWGIKRPDDGLWYDQDGLFWIDPFQREAWDYNIALAQEIARLGFDEIQFDYIRFPADANASMMVLSTPISPKDNPGEMYQLIAEYLEKAHQAINAAGAFFSVDVFGLVTWRPMWEVGQKLDLMMTHTDYICPMIYPSLYSAGDVGYEIPDAFPYDIVLESLRKGRKQMGDGARARFRPWLQGFNAVWLENYSLYGREMIQLQVQAVADFHQATGWSLWNPTSDYDPNWFNP